MRPSRLRNPPGPPRLSRRKPVSLQPRRSSVNPTYEKYALSRSWLRRFFGRTLGLDLADRVHHRIEGQHRRGVPRLVVADRLEQSDIAPFTALGRLAVLLQHLANGLAQLAQFAGRRADDMGGHDRGRGLA